MLDELGPTFVKFGQLLSTRPDLVPPEIAAELRQLQDAVSPLPWEDVERVIQEELHGDVGTLFASFEREPVAAASIGQVHLAELVTGRRVAVKVQRPTAPAQIESDIVLLRQIAKIVKSGCPVSTSSTRPSWSTSSPARSGASSTTASRPATRRRSARRSPTPRRS